MAGPINLNVLDPVDLDQVSFGPDAKRWLTDVVDIINASFVTISQAFANLITAAGIDVGGAGAGPITVTVVGLTSSGFVNVQLISSSNPVTISSVVPGNGSFAITFSADPGASAIIVYQAFTVKPQ